MSKFDTNQKKPTQKFGWSLLSLILASALIITYQNCSIEDPITSAIDGSNNNASAGTSTFDHANIGSIACFQCHEKDRPAPVGDQAHGGGADCVGCHIAGRDWLSTKGFDHVGITNNCASCHGEGASSAAFPVNHRLIDGRDCSTCHRPGTWPSALFSHDPKPTACAGCHQDKFPTVHVPTNGQDCVSCHNTTLWTGADPHDPVPTECASCHGTDGNFPRWPNNHRMTDGSDCISCHTTSGWASAQFAHDPQPSQCASCHQQDFPDGHVATSGQDCAACHSPNANWASAVFNHDPVPNSCTSCHQGDRPNTGRRMDRDPNLNNNDSHYGQVDCYTCHQTPNTATQWRFNHTDARATNVKVCLPCHYDRGIREHGNRANWFQPPIYDFNNGDLGNCYNCHRKRRSWDE